MGRVRGLVMELIEGRTLAERLAAGPLPIDEALGVARQIAEALEAAHEKGIIHRDLKPGNVKITPEGVVKVLDFGLAKIAEPAAATSSSSPTMTMRATQAGVLMGTAAYMSPEQARGTIVDKRADIWAYGVVLFEMLTGRDMFSGETVSDTLAAVLKTEIDWPALPPETPLPIRRLLRRCLERDRKKRLRDIGDALIEIDEARAAAPGEQAMDAAASHRSRAIPWVVTAMVAMGAVAVSLLHFREAPPDNRLLKFSILPPEGARFDTIVVSPDGRRLAFTAFGSRKVRLWVRPLDSLTAQPLAVTDGAIGPFWSPDSRYIGFFAGGKLKKIDASGGPAQTLCDIPAGRSGEWSRDGVIIIHGAGMPLSRVSAEGGEIKPVTSLDSARHELGHVWPVFLPDGRHLLYTITGSLTETGIYLGELDSNNRTLLLGEHSNAKYVPSASGAGYLLFWRGGSLMAQPFDPDKRRLSSEPVPIAEQVDHDPVSNRGSFSASENGVLVYDSSGAVQVERLVWFDRSGKRLGTLGEPGRYVRPAISPDERYVAVDRFDPQTRTNDLWVIEVANDISTRFTFDAKDYTAPVWSPDGRTIAFSSNREGGFGLYQKLSNGAGKEELTLKSVNLKRPSDWSPDGRHLLYYELSPKTNFDLWVLPLMGDRRPVPFLQTEFTELAGVFSPDGKWIAYQSSEFGQFEVYVQPFPATGAKWQISRNGGAHPRWRGDGKELFYMGSGESSLMGVEIKLGATLQVGISRPLFEINVKDRFTLFAVTRDGQRFLIPTPVGEASAPPVTAVVNWMAGLKR